MIANGSHWPHLPPDGTTSFLTADCYRRPRERGVRSQRAREVRANWALYARRCRRVGR